MESLYWTFEYISVLLGYLFLMFLWPMVVFGRHLRGKSLTWRFGFCVTVQPVLVSTVVLGLGLFRLLDRRVTAGLFYGVFFAVLLYRAARLGICTISEVFRTKRRPPRFVRTQVRERIWDFRRSMRPRVLEYAVLSLVILSGVLYFSYGSSRLHGYGYGDLYVHHSWIYGLVEGRIFADGVYPQAMHCFVYCMNAMFGIQIYSILLYLQCVHVWVFLLSGYFLLREVFRWKYTSILVLTLYLTLDVAGADMIYAMSRLQWTLPLEFGLHTPLLCMLFFMRYLKNARGTVYKGKTSKCCWDSNLFLFLMSLAASVAIHYYATMMAFLMCVSVTVFAWRKVFRRKRLIPLCCAVLCGCLIAAAPMGAALAGGMPFNYSIRWALNSMDGENTRELRDAREETQEDGETEGRESEGRKDAEEQGQEESQERQGSVERKDAEEQGQPQGQEESQERQGSEERKDTEEQGQPPREQKEPEGQEQPQGQKEPEAQEPPAEQKEPEGQEPSQGQKESNIWEKLGGIYRYGYARLYGSGRAARILALTGIAIVLEAVRRRKRGKDSAEREPGYAPVILVSFLFILTYAMPYVGLPELISDSRFCTVGHLMVLAVGWMPVDAVFAGIAAGHGDVFQQGAMAFSAMAIYAVTLLTGNYRGFLFYEMVRYDAAVMVTNSIIEAFPKYNFLIISPTDELYSVIEYGWHEELLTFLRNCEKEDYSVSPEYVFLYVEKKPLLYAQAHFFEGPFWLGQEKYLEPYWEEYSRKHPGHDASQSPEIITSDVSGAEAQKSIAETTDAWSIYTGLETRTILESKVYEWCQRFIQQHPYELNVYYEDEFFVCYYFVQDVNAPYKLGVYE